MTTAVIADRICRKAENELSLQEAASLVKRSSLIAAVILLVIGMASDGHALIAGIRYTSVTRQLLPGIDGYGQSRPFTFYAGDRKKNSDFLIGIGYDRYKRDVRDSLLYARRLVVDVGYRYGLMSADKVQAMKILPFVGIHYYMAFAKVRADSTVMSQQDVKYRKDLADDQGGWVSAGVEYFFAPSFSMGCEAGLLYMKAKSSAYGYKISLSEYRTFVAILMSVRL